MGLLRVVRLIVTILLLLNSNAILAFQFGPLQLASYYDEPLFAEIELSEISSPSTAAVEVKIAAASEFIKAGIKRSRLLTMVKIDVVEVDQKFFVQLKSNEPINTTYLDVLLDVHIGEQQKLKNFTLIFDPRPSELTQLINNDRVLVGSVNTLREISALDSTELTVLDEPELAITDARVVGDEGENEIREVVLDDDDDLAIYDTDLLEVDGEYIAQDELEAEVAQLERTIHVGGKKTILGEFLSQLSQFRKEYIDDAPAGNMIRTSIQKTASFSKKIQHNFEDFNLELPKGSDFVYYIQNFTTELIMFLFAVFFVSSILFYLIKKLFIDKANFTQDTRDDEFVTDAAGLLDEFHRAVSSDLSNTLDQKSADGSTNTKIEETNIGASKVPSNQNLFLGMAVNDKSKISSSQQASDTFAVSSETKAKLDLAQRYVDIGDISQATDILQSVISNGGTQEVSAAQDLLNSITKH